MSAVISDKSELTSLSDIDDVLAEARENNIALWSENGNLRFRAMRDSLSPEFRKKLARHKPLLIETLSAPSYSSIGSVKHIRFLRYHFGLWDNICNGEFGTWFTNATQNVFGVEGLFNIHAYERALRQVAARHPILTTRVDDSSGVPHFVFDQPLTLNVEDLSASNLDFTDEKSLEVVSAMVWRSFELRTETLFRPLLVHLSPTKHVIGFVLNHLIGDASSVGILTAELLYHYESILSSAQSQIPPPVLQYADYIANMNGWLKTSARIHRLNYWRRQLTNAKECKLLVDRHVDQDQSCEVLHQAFSFDQNATKDIALLAQQASVPSAVVMIAIYALALKRCTSQSDITILSMHHGRDDARTHSMIGSTQNQLFLRMHIADNISIVELAKSFQRVQLAAIENQITSGFVRDTFDDIGAGHCFPELNNFVRHVSANPKDNPQPENSSQQAEPAIKIVRVSVKQYQPTKIKAKNFPGHKLMLWGDMQGIHGRVEYLADEYDQSTISNFISALTNCASVVRD